LKELGQLKNLNYLNLVGVTQSACLGSKYEVA
jgi:hypothetical protein